MRGSLQIHFVVEEPPSLPSISEEWKPGGLHHPPPFELPHPLSCLLQVSAKIGLPILFMMVVLILATYVPGIVTFLPGLLFD